MLTPILEHLQLLLRIVELSLNLLDLIESISPLLNVSLYCFYLRPQAAQRILVIVLDCLQKL